MPAKTISFRIGDVFDAEDDLAIWLATIALAHNDLVLTHVRQKEAKTEWQYFYDWRIAVGHYSEIMGFLGRMRERPAIKDFISTSPTELQRAYEAALEQYKGSRKIAKHIRNEAAFHYPDPKGIKAMRRALRSEELRNGTGGVTSSSGKVGDTRIHFADEIMAKMLMNATGGTEQALGEAFASLGEAVAAFMGFANQAQDEFFLRQPEGVVKVSLGEQQ